MNCPACDHTKYKTESNDRLQCLNCGWRFKISTHGKPVDLFDLARAGKQRRKNVTLFEGLMK